MEAEKGLFKNSVFNSNVKFLSNHNPKEAIADIVDSDGSFKFRDHITEEEIEIILSWLKSQGVKIILK